MRDQPTPSVDRQKIWRILRIIYWYLKSFIISFINCWYSIMRQLTYIDWRALGPNQWLLADLNIVYAFRIRTKHALMALTNWVGKRICKTHKKIPRDIRAQTDLGVFLTFILFLIKRCFIPFLPNSLTILGTERCNFRELCKTVLEGKYICTNNFSNTF